MICKELSFSVPLRKKRRASLRKGQYLLFYSEAQKNCRLEAGVAEPSVSCRDRRCDGLAFDPRAVDRSPCVGVGDGVFQDVGKAPRADCVVAVEFGEASDGGGDAD